MDKKIQVAILDDHQNAIDGYQFRVNQHSNIEIAAQAYFGCDLENLWQQPDIDVLILDISVPISPQDPNPYPILTEIAKIKTHAPHIHLIIISMFSQAIMIQAILDAGADAYILKDDRAAMVALGDIILQIMVEEERYISPIAQRQLSARNSKIWALTPRQMEVLNLIAAYPEATSATLAEELGVAHSTCRNLLSTIYQKLGVSNRTAAILKAREIGIVAPK